ncbi:MAG: hypothetical protein ACD_62C00271G0009 [uncultured bacterium]|nr:MAG: hypothetical protein ACD_62C00271G0009 [uncultured bacterium]
MGFFLYEFAVDVFAGFEGFVLFPIGNDDPFQREVLTQRLVKFVSVEPGDGRVGDDK